jgi:Zn-dependent protease
MDAIIQTIAVYALPLVFAITLHEAAHAYAAKYLGDSTAYMQGRMSLNPIKHIDPVGTLLIPAVMFFVTSGAFVFGYAKPVPVEWGRLRKPKRDMAWVALAGPAANFIMALLWAILGIVLEVAGISEPFLTRMVKAGIFVNLLIFAFNLLPIPPLDGGRILTSLLPNRLAYSFSRIEPYGFFIVIGLVVLNWMHYWLDPVRMATQAALRLLLLPVVFLLT